jgi:trk system potassium uptake protein TrkA
MPRGDTLIGANDHLLVIGKGELIRENLHLLGIVLRPAKTVFIIGGGRVGFNVAHMLEQDEVDYNVKVLEHNAQRCHFLAGRLPHTLVLHGNATDVKVLKEEGIADIDAVVVVTDDEGTNLIAALLAKTSGARSVITSLSGQTWSL